MFHYVVTQKKMSNQSDMACICNNGIRARIIILTIKPFYVQEYDPSDPDGLIVSIKDEDTLEFTKKMEELGMFANPINDDEIRFAAEWRSFNHNHH